MSSSSRGHLLYTLITSHECPDVKILSESPLNADREVDYKMHTYSYNQNSCIIICTPPSLEDQAYVVTAKQALTVSPTCP